MIKKKTLTIFSLIVVLLSLFGFCACTGAATGTEYDVVKRTKMENFDLLNESARRGQIVMIGDSIVELYPTYELFADPSQPVVYNRGISGDTSDRMLERLQRNALNIAPSVLSILVGTNDLARGIALEEVLGNLRNAIGQAQAAGVSKIVVQGLYPVHYDILPSMVGGRKNKDILRWNEAYRQLCAETGAVFADLHDVLADGNGEFDARYTYDGLHPNAQGYVAITDALKPILGYGA